MRDALLISPLLGRAAERLGEDRPAVFEEASGDRLGRPAGLLESRGWSLLGIARS
jgi:hypothetical protein